jgi:FMN phosphatase YigB (HAD superfamily)
MDVSRNLVTFDIGGVLVRLSTSLEEAARLAGVALRDATPDAARWSSLFVQWQSGQVADPLFFEQWAACVGRFDACDAAALSLGWLQEEYAGMEALVGELVSSGVATGCLSNTSAHHWDYLMEQRERYPSLGHIQHAHASHRIGAMKPHEVIYRAYEALTGYGPGEIVFFDDLQANVEAALRCGWRAVRVDPRGEPAALIRANLEQLGILQPKVSVPGGNESGPGARLPG